MCTNVRVAASCSRTPLTCLSTASWRTTCRFAKSFPSSARSWRVRVAAAAKVPTSLSRRRPTAAAAAPQATGTRSCRPPQSHTSKYSAAVWRSRPLAASLNNNLSPTIPITTSSISSLCLPMPTRRSKQNTTSNNNNINNSSSSSSKSITLNLMQQ